MYRLLSRLTTLFCRRRPWLSCLVGLCVCVLIVLLISTTILQAVEQLVGLQKQHLTNWLALQQAVLEADALDVDATNKARKELKAEK